MDDLCEAVQDKIKDWGGNPSDFKLEGPELFGVMQAKPTKKLSYLIQYVYEYVRAALQHR